MKLNRDRVMFAFQIFDMASTMIQRIRDRRLSRKLKEQELNDGKIHTYSFRDMGNGSTGADKTS